MKANTHSSETSPSLETPTNSFDSISLPIRDIYYFQEKMRNIEERKDLFDLIMKECQKKTEQGTKMTDPSTTKSNLLINANKNSSETLPSLENRSSSFLQNQLQGEDISIDNKKMEIIHEMQDFQADQSSELIDQTQPQSSNQSPQNSQTRPIPKLKNCLSFLMHLIIILVHCKIKKKNDELIKLITTQKGRAKQEENLAHDDIFKNWLSGQKKIECSSDIKTNQQSLYILKKLKKQKKFAKFYFNKLLESPECRDQFLKLGKGEILQKHLNSKINQAKKNQLQNKCKLNRAYQICYKVIYGFQSIFGIVLGYSERHNVEEMISIIQLTLKGYYIRINNIKNRKTKQFSKQIPDQYFNRENQTESLAEKKKMLVLQSKNQFTKICESDQAVMKSKKKTTLNNHLRQLRRQENVLKYFKDLFLRLNKSDLFQEEDYLDPEKSEHVNKQENFLFHKIHTTWKVNSTEFASFQKQFQGEYESVTEFFKRINPMVKIFSNVYFVRTLQNQKKQQKKEQKMEQEQNESYKQEKEHEQMEVECNNISPTQSQASDQDYKSFRKDNATQKGKRKTKKISKK